MQQLQRIGEWAGRWFPLIVIVAGAAALAAPAAFRGWSPAVPWLLALIMLGMGLTLRPVDFTYVARRPIAFVIGVVAQFVIMPGIGWLLATLLPVGPELAVGIILVACAPGGTASNVMVYLAKGDTALSVAMTSASTLLAPLVTPVLVLALAGRFLPVDPGALFVSILQVVVVPVLLGFLLRRFAERQVQAVLPALPLVSVVGITVVVMAVVAGSASALLASGLLILVAVVAHNVLGLGLGYVAARLCGLDETARRAIAIEVGMQNSGLSATLATTHFNPVAALPAAVFSVWHNISGSLLAGYWARRPVAVPPDRSQSRAG